MKNDVNHFHSIGFKNLFVSFCLILFSVASTFSQSQKNGSQTKINFPYLTLNASSFFEAYENKTLKKLTFPFHMVLSKSKGKPNTVTLLCYLMYTNDKFKLITIDIKSDTPINKLLKSPLNFGNLEITYKQMKKISGLKETSKLILVPSQYDGYVFYKIYLDNITGKAEVPLSINPCPPKCPE